MTQPDNWPVLTHRSSYDVPPTCLCGQHSWNVSEPYIRMLGAIVLAGPVRTGSTKVHQMLKLINEIRTKDSNFVPAEDYSGPDDVDSEIVKTHSYFKDACPFVGWAPVIFFCIRHPFFQLP